MHWFSLISLSSLSLPFPFSSPFHLFLSLSLSLIQCVLQNDNAIYAVLNSCNLDNSSTWTITTHDNKLYAPRAQASVMCGNSDKELVSLAHWQQATGKDKGTTLGDMPSVKQMMAWGRAVLHWRK